MVGCSRRGISGVGSQVERGLLEEDGLLEKEGLLEGCYLQVTTPLKPIKPHYFKPHIDFFGVKWG